MSSFVVAILVGVGVLALLVFVFRSSRARHGGASDSSFADVPDGSPWFSGSHGSGCSGSASDGGGCDGGGSD